MKRLLFFFQEQGGYSYHSRVPDDENFGLLMPDSNNDKAEPEPEPVKSPIVQYRVGDFIVTEDVRARWCINPGQLYRVASVGIIVAGMYSRDDMNQEAALAIYPDKTKHFTKEMNVLEMFMDLIRRTNRFLGMSEECANEWSN